MGVAAGCDGRVIGAQRTVNDGTDMSVPYDAIAVANYDGTVTVTTGDGHAVTVPLTAASPTKRDAAQVEIRSGKSHSTIWGPSVKRLNDIPSADARTVFQTIMQVDGITRITLGPFSGGDRRKKVCATVRASNQDHIVEGKIFDAGKKGTMQTFQVRTQHADTAARILADITDKLKASGRWAK